MNKETKKTLWIVGIIVILCIAALFYSSVRTVESKYDTVAFAQCLKEKNITMYGAEWCSHCKTQKTLFGNAFKYVPYVECPENTQKCLDLGVEGYPTWILPDGTKLVGEQSLEILAQASSCPLNIKAQ